MKLEKRFIIGLCVSLAVIALVLVLFFVRAGREPGLPEDAVKWFCSGFFASLPPGAPDPTIVALAHRSLTGPARADIGRDLKKGDPASVLGALIHFSGIASFPDRGYTIDMTVQSEDAAMVRITLNYSGKVLYKAVYLKLEGGRWRIDSIKDWPTS